ncbi:MAG: TRAP transporter substrate-binding protein DctP [Planctomycetia bacterium]|nr:TRAP transporter substrate-binding protein DctP [Planctomycetia bacterium]
MKRLGLLVVISTVFLLAWRQYEEIPLLVIGQLSSSGLLQQRKEAPFFQNLRNTTQLPLQVTYKPLETVGFKDTHQLRMLKEGLFDLVSLRFLQNRAAEPGLEGIDLAGLIPDYKTAEQVVRAYSPTLDRYLQERFKVKLLGVWTFGPQEFFSRTPIRHLEDLRGRKVRVGDASLATVISALGGIPAVIPFDDTEEALAIGLVDCAVSSAASASHAGWTEHAPYYFPLAVHFGLNGYVISLKKWNEFSPRQRVILQRAFDDYLADLWRFSQQLHEEAARGGGDLGGPDGSCQLVLAEPSADDVRLLHEIAIAKSLPAWAEKCRKSRPECPAEWREKLAAFLDLPTSSAPSP